MRQVLEEDFIRFDKDGDRCVDYKEITMCVPASRPGVYLLVCDHLRVGDKVLFSCIFSLPPELDLLLLADGATSTLKLYQCKVGTVPSCFFATNELELSSNL